MITSLTKEQEEQIHVFIKKWVDKASEPIDRAKLPDTVKRLFGEDKIVIVGESLQNTIDLIKVVAGGKKLTRRINSQLSSQLSAELSSQLGANKKLCDELQVKLRAQLCVKLRSQLNTQLSSQLCVKLRSQLSTQLDSQLGSQLSSQLNTQLRAELGETYDYYVGLWWSVLNAWYDYGKYIGVKLDEKKLQLFNDYQDTMPIAIFVGNVVFVCEKPKCYWNERGQLHSAKHPAIKWEDGTGIYILNGVKFEQDMFIKVTQKPEDGGLPNKERAKYILRIADVDQRTQAMRFLPPSDLIKALKGKELDSVSKLAADGTEVYYKLITFPKGDVFTTDAYYMYFNCPSTNKEHIEGVIKSSTVKEAMAWREDTTEEAWALKVPLTHET